MKRYKRIGILLGVLLVVCAATFWMQNYEEKKEQIKNSDEIVLAIPADSVKTLAWEYESEKLSFHREDRWIYDGDSAFPVDGEKIGRLLETFESFGAAFVIDEVEDYGQYGLAEPLCTVTLTTEEASYEILLGNFSTMDQERYVSIGDGRVYLMKEDPLDAFDATLSDVIDHDETLPVTEAEAIAFAGADSYSVSREEDSADTYCADDVYFTDLNGEKLPLDTDLVKAYLQAVSRLNLTDYVTYNATEEELKNCGLDSPELTVTVNYTEGGEEDAKEAVFVLHVGSVPGEETAGEDSETEPERDAYVRVGESPILYRITADEYAKLSAASRNDLRHREVFPGDFGDVSQIEISLEGGTYVMDSEKAEDSESRTWSYQGGELEIGGLQSALGALRADSFTEEEPSQKEEIRLILHLENENFPQVEIAFYRYDGSFCLAQTDGKTVSLVPRSQVIDLIESVNAVILNPAS